MENNKPIQTSVTENVDIEPMPAPVPQAPFIVRLIIMTFVLAYISGALFLIVDLWIHEHGMLSKLMGLSKDESLPALFISGMHAVLGAVLGAGVLDIVSFHKYVAVRRDFQLPHVWGYFFAPWLAAVLGLIVFALLQSGLLIFTGGGEEARSKEVANLGFLAIGFLSGFGWFEALGKIRALVKRFFSTDLAKRRSSPKGITERMNGMKDDKAKTLSDSGVDSKGDQLDTNDNST